MARRTLSAILHREEDLYVAECPEVGTVSQGSTFEEALANLREATELYLEEFPLPERSAPLLTTFEIAVDPGCLGSRARRPCAPSNGSASCGCDSAEAM